MRTSRRVFIKQSAGAVAVGLVAPHALLSRARAQARPAGGRRLLVVIQLAGGNDGFNTVIPYTDSRYYALRPTLAFKESELTATTISNEFGLHPALTEIKALYDEGKVGVVNGVGYPNPSLSHFLSMDIYHTANPDGGRGLGWLGKYADTALVNKPGLTAASVGGLPVKSLLADRAVLPNILNFEAYDFLTDPVHAGDRNNQVQTFARTNQDQFREGSFIGQVASSGMQAVESAAVLKASVNQYRSTVVYPASNPLAQGLKMLAQLITTIPEIELLYVQMGGFDTHANQVGQGNKLAGDHARLHRYFSEGVRLFYDDMTEHGLAGDVLIMQWSEFGRRPQENASLGTDHGTAVPMFIIGDAVRGGIYGDYPSLLENRLDPAGNVVHTVDFREVYATILDKWLGVDSSAILGSRYSDVGFLG